MKYFSNNIVSVLANVAINEPFSYRLAEGKKVKRGSIVKIPLGSKKVLGAVWGVPKDNKAHNRLREIEHIYDVKPLSEELLKTIDFMADYTLANKGMLLRSVLNSPQALKKPKPIIAYRLSGKMPKRMSKARQRVIKVLSDGLARQKRELKEASMVSASVIEGLLANGTLSQIEISAPKEIKSPNIEFSNINLSKEQQLALDELRAMKEGFGVALLDGVTGAGKSEIFFERVADIIKQKKQALILLPEIALTQSFIDRFTKRFGVEPAQWHSDMSKSERAKIWRGVSDSSIRVIIGARSALFLPFSQLGLIVLDEEHDGAYKQSEGLIYHARTMAIMRAKFANAKLILSSATPSVESRHNANIGKYKHVRLNKRFFSAAMPDINIIDMRLEGPPKGKFIAPKLAREIGKTLNNNEQVLLFLNRRGYAPLTLCRACGYKFQCSNCSTWLVEHRLINRLMCHHCGFEIKRPDKCPQCEEEETLVPIGPGIERIAQEARELFPDARQIVLSSDMGEGFALKQRFLEIERGEYNLIIGTQLVAKGHHFEKLTLVGVLDADLGLANGDPRAAENSFQILTQVTGRAGRAAKKGRAYLQTYYPKNDVIIAMKNQDSEEFYRHELSIREQGGLPPFGRLAAFIISADKREAALDYARYLVALAPKPTSAKDLENLKIYGPADAPIPIIRAKHRIRILVRSDKKFDLSAYIKFWLANANKPKSNIKVQIDIDPISFY